ncbi:DMT family transporter [Corallococcus exercitus]|uniref:DMT family transporter n=1 Tax=Corallococcus exercitus TaxID=2316736 RepID=A0A3A8INJ8_9BACT|nr:DMT family transporter [Corallococcus exercitus]NOK35740.1 DMT family transporter [Corallococcus exercitus]RKG81464.1 DMT family transporter [Corallococcus exercitus]
MSVHRKPADGFALGTMLVLCAIWGMQQVAVKLAAPHIPTMMQMALRSGLAAVLVGLLCWLRGERGLLRRGPWRAGMLVGVLFASEFLFVGEGLRHTHASHMGVFLYTAPVFSALGLHWLVPSERLKRTQWLGIGVAFAGIALAFGGGWLQGGIGPGVLLGDTMGLLAGLAWGATTVAIRVSALSDAPPTQTLLYQLVGGVAILLPVALLTGQAGPITMAPVAWASLLFQGVIVCFASYLAWFWLLRRYLASNLSVFSFMTPLFGVSAGIFVLNEQADLSFAVGAVLVLTGILIVSGAGLLRSASALKPGET